MKIELYKYEECTKRFIMVAEECKRIHSALQDSNLNGEIFAIVKQDLEEMSRKCEAYANLFDAYKRRFEEEKTMNCVYASPDIMSRKLSDIFK